MMYYLDAGGATAKSHSVVVELREAGQGRSAPFHELARIASCDVLRVATAAAATDGDERADALMVYY